MTIQLALHNIPHVFHVIECGGLSRPVDPLIQHHHHHSLLLLRLRLLPITAASMSTFTPQLPPTAQQLAELYPASLELRQVQVLFRHGCFPPSRPTVPLPSLG